MSRLKPFARVSPTPPSAGGHERGDNSGQTPAAPPSRSEGSATGPGLAAASNRKRGTVRPEPALAAELERLARKYPSWMYPHDLAREEACSVDTARRRLAAGHYGPAVDQLPGGSLRLLTAHYCQTVLRRQRDLT